MECSQSVLNLIFIFLLLRCAVKLEHESALAENARNTPRHVINRIEMKNIQIRNLKPT